MDANREYKDTLFSKLFSDPSSLREIYNALANTDYNEDTPIEINTLEDAFFNDLKNDVSFVIAGKSVVLVEHQSTPSKNMPLRFLLYIARLYEKITDDRTMYREKLLSIPTPEFIVLYNGVKPFPTEMTLKLSDAYMAESNPTEIFGSLELTVRVVNINIDNNAELLNKSETLRGYSTFVERVRRNQRHGMELSDAISKAVKWCVEENVLASFLTQYESEVQNMLTTEFNIDIAKEVWQEEARKDGFAEGEAIGVARGEAIGEAIGETIGEKKGKLEMAYDLLALGIPIEAIEKASGMKIDEINGRNKN